MHNVDKTVARGLLNRRSRAPPYSLGLHEHASELKTDACGDANIARTDTPCNIDQTQPTQPKLEDWEEAFRHEPLKSVKLDARKTQRSKHEVIQIAKFPIDYRHVLMVHWITGTIRH